MLLNKGASAIIKTDEGDTPLSILKEWQQKESPIGEDLFLCESLIERMTEIMNRAGQTVSSNSSFNQSHRESRLQPKIPSLKTCRPIIEKRTIRPALVDLDDDDEVISGNL